MNDYQRIEKAIRYLDENFRDQPSVDDVAAHVGVSASHFHRLFQRWAGITPKRFLECVTATHARRLLTESRPVMDAAWQCGLSGGSRLHDLFVGLEGVTPGQVQRRGDGLNLYWGIHDSPFGACLLAMSERGVSALRFVESDEAGPALTILRQQWPRAQLLRDQARTADPMKSIIAALADGRAHGLRLDAHGTNFQVRVWAALLAIPPGQVVSYGQVASAIGHPDAVRATGTAVGANPVALLIPCHRVLRASGGFGMYAGGSERKRAILAWEHAGATKSGSGCPG
jgi:AraC family transcriptional regulator, regulatory protein of adaptative response / methylated-DNA-[protein]-cysteine methyltransferase